MPEHQDSAPVLSGEDQARVDAYISRGVHSVDRKPFRPWMLMGVIVVVLTALSFLSLVIARTKGVV
ncbi:DUF3094 family protein [Biformimicrobium ophioploci]|uniref:DUF3094 domain-containing protein n=1 Tax=Biformimicrobium ophioploci TaxID=3036711 RepID=A0ABQ6LUM1_9GAMM|nr:DUF3094 family protein [Microbulbifer sp. NKW57]GMG85770.1 hypothetical protein MNKW57_00910 [Microbulbifer sp. NKW57]